MKHVFFSLFLSISAQAIWLAEICLVKSWKGLNWLHEELYSPILCASLVSFAFLYHFWDRRKQSLAILIFVGLSLVNCLFYWAGKSFFYMLFSKFSLLYFSQPMKYLLLALLGYLLIALIYAWVLPFNDTRRRIATYLLLLLAFIVTPFLSMASIKIWPGFGTGTDWVDAVKMGYPIFWTTLTLGLTGFFVKLKAW
jgi:hypothetical protein